MSAVALVAILALLAVFQVSLAAGAPFGQFAWGGQNRVLPTRQRVGSVAAVVAYAGIALVVLDRANQIDLLSELASHIAAWIVFAFFTLSIAGNAMSRSRFERLVMVPTTAVLALLSLLVALG
jgi:hypothetical protein